MYDVKPIETEYKGYRFRSRLEARYAVFFDALKIEFEYEPEGFHLSSGDYLPDFWLPQHELWVEVKPDEGITERAEKLATELCESTNFPVIVTNGLPGNYYDGLFIYKGFDSFFSCRNETLFSKFKLAHYLSFTLDDCEEEQTAKLGPLRNTLRAAVLDMDREFGYPKTCKTSFCFETLYRNKKPIPTICLENHTAVVYKKLTEKNTEEDLYRWWIRGPLYDRLIKLDFDIVVHCDTQHVSELPDDYTYNNHLVGRALSKAKRARFEHGENGI